MTRRLKGTAQLVALACVAGLLALLVWQVAHQQHAPSVGSQAPAFTLRRLDGPGKVSLAAYRGQPGRAELLGVVVPPMQGGGSRASA